jgi:hypothetical protein
MLQVLLGRHILQRPLGRMAAWPSHHPHVRRRDAASAGRQDSVALCREVRRLPHNMSLLATAAVAVAAAATAAPEPPPLLLPPLSALSLLDLTCAQHGRGGRQLLFCRLETFELVAPVARRQRDARHQLYRVRHANDGARSVGIPSELRPFGAVRACAGTTPSGLSSLPTRRALGCSTTSCTTCAPTRSRCTTCTRARATRRAPRCTHSSTCTIAAEASRARELRATASQSHFTVAPAANTVADTHENRDVQGAK